MINNKFIIYFISMAKNTKKKRLNNNIKTSNLEFYREREIRTHILV